MNGIIKRRRLVVFDDHGRSTIAREWTRERGWTVPEFPETQAAHLSSSDRVLSRAKALLARMQPIDQPEPVLDDAALRRLWGAPASSSSNGTAGLPGPRNATLRRGVGRNTRFV